MTTTFLDIGCGPYRFLVDIDEVIEVGGATAQADVAGCRQWRGQSLRVVDLAGLLGRPDATAGQQVILRDAHSRQAALALDVGQVHDLLDIDETRLQPLGGLSPDLDALVDGACVASGGICLLRLRPHARWPAGNPGAPP